MTLSDCLKEIEQVMENAARQKRDLTGEEVIHILKMQEKEIKRQISLPDNFTDEEALAEHFSNKEYFKDRDKIRR